MLIFFLAGGMGAGDVKQLAAVGALGGWPFILVAAAYSILIGGILASITLARHGRFAATLRNALWVLIGLLTMRRWGGVAVEADPHNRLTIPMGFAISLGSVLAVVDHLGHLGFL